MMFTFEWLVVCYCSAWLLAGAVLQVHRRALVIAGSSSALLVVALASSFGSSALRFWLAHAYLVAGYLLPALTVNVSEAQAVDASTRFESWLVGTDRALRPWLPPIPSTVAGLAEVAYLLCYPLVPISFGLVWMRGTIDDVDRFWATVLSAGFACYASLPWLLSRPPRVLEASPAKRGGVSGLNVRVLNRLSHQWNTFPSGHVAVSCAASWSVTAVWPAAGVPLGILAAAVAVGAAAGRYHYVVDVLLGVLIAAAAAMVTAALAG